MTTPSDSSAPGSSAPGTSAPGERPGRARPAPIATTVRRTQRLSPTMVRVVLGGEGLNGFAPEQFSDAYVKLLFPPADDADRPRLRTYTVRTWDPATLELTLDFVVHGDEGLAGPWARSARPGDELQLLGPGGGYSPDPAADWHLLIGDESALPAIAASLERLPAGAIGHVLVEIAGAEQQQELPAPAGMQLQWVLQGAQPLGELLLETVAGLVFPAGRVHAFVHGEAGTVKALRRFLRQERGVAMPDMSISGYWRLGADDESWRAIKRSWNAEIEQSEAVPGPS